MFWLLLLFPRSYINKLSLSVMGERIPSGSFHHHPPSGPNHPSPHWSASIPFDPQRYFAELLAERQRLVPFAQILPHCSRLVNQEISRQPGYNQGFMDHERYKHESPFRSLAQHPSERPMDFEALSTMQMKENVHLQRMGTFMPTPMGWPGVPAMPPLKKVIRLDFPVDKYPNYNFVGRLLGPRGNCLKKIEAYTGCKVFIRGKGSIKDPIEEEKLKDKPEYEHLSESLHVLVEAEFPEDEVNARMDKAIEILERLMKPVDESLDKDKKDQIKELATITSTLNELDKDKKDQIKELATINSTLNEESLSMSPSMPPFNTAG